MITMIYTQVAERRQQELEAGAREYRLAQLARRHTRGSRR